MKRVNAISSIYTAWIYLVVLYGMNLYFFGNADLDNPDAPLIIPLLKDVLWVALVIICLYLGGNVVHKSAFSYFLVVCIFCAAFVTIIYFTYDEINLSYVKFFKNQILYVGLTFIFIGVVSSSISRGSLLLTLQTALLVSMAVSLLLFFFHPVQSHTGRLFGTYGNPNSAGLIAVFSVALYFAIRPEERSAWRTMATVVLGGATLVYAASLTAIMATIVLLPLIYLLRPRTEKNIWLTKLAVTTLWVALVGGFIALLVTFQMLYDFTPLAGRVVSLINDGVEHESIAIRWFDYLKMLDMERPINDKFTQMDGSLATFGFNFGLAGIGFLVVIFGRVFIEYALMQRFTSISHPSFFHVPALLALLAVLAVLISPLQYAFEVFPTNFLIATTIAVLAIDFRKMRAAGHLKGPQARARHCASVRRPS